MADDRKGGKFGSSMLASFSRAKQLASEKLGKAEKTEYEAAFEQLASRLDRAKDAVEKIIKQTEAYLEPNTGRRLESTFNEKFSRKSTRLPNELEILGAALQACGVDYGQDLPFGSALARCGALEAELGEKYAGFQAQVREQFTKPLKSFVDQDVKSLTAERKALNRCRLDLDAARSSAKSSGVATPQEEEDLRVAVEAFQKQYEITRVLLERAQRATDAHVQRVIALLDAQHLFFSAAAEATANLSRDLRRTSGIEPPSYLQSIGAKAASSIAALSSPAAAATSAAAAAGAAAASASSGEEKRARVLCSYEPRDPSELALSVDDVVLARKDATLPAGWLMARIGTREGRVQEDYLDFDDV